MLKLVGVLAGGIFVGAVVTSSIKIYSLIGRRGEPCTHKIPSNELRMSNEPRKFHRAARLSGSVSASSCRRVQNAAASAPALKLVGS